jgi:hypothetical protein
VEVVVRAPPVLSSPAAATLAAVALAVLGLAHAAAGAPDGLGRRSVHGGGVAHAFNGPFVLGGTAGQPDAGTLARPGWSITGGFWSGAVAVLAVDPAPDPPEPEPLPLAFALHPLEPNPARAWARVRFDLPAATEARLEVFDLQGRLVQRLAEGAFAAGPHALRWSGAGPEGRRLPGGLYVIRLTTPEHRAMRKLVLVP